MAGEFLIYGASGYSGRLIAHEARRQGLSPILAGRDPRKLEALAAELGLEHRVAALDDGPALARLLRGVRVVVHAAGPFSGTARAMVGACLHAGAHYLDLCGEVLVIEGLRAHDADARSRSLTLMPAVGCDVVASDCLIAHVASRLPRATSIELGVSGLGFTTRGSWQTLLEQGGLGAVRRDGVLTRVPAGVARRGFDFGSGPRDCVNVVWGDVATAVYTTGIGDIAVYFESTPYLEAMLAVGRVFGEWTQARPAQLWLEAWAQLLPEGPSAAERAARRLTYVAEVRDTAGRSAAARLYAPEAYSLTATAACAVVQRVLAGDYEVGFQTAARVYGADFALSLPGVWREDLPAAERAA